MPYRRKYGRGIPPARDLVACAVVRGGEHRRRQLLRDFDREARTRQHDHRPAGPSSCAMTSDMRSSVSGSRPFVALTIVARGARMRRGRAHHRAAAVRRESRTRSSSRPASASASACVDGHAWRATRCPADRPRSRGARACRRRAPDRAPTAARRGRRGRDARRAPSPSCRRRAPRSRRIRLATPTPAFRAGQTRAQVRPMPEHDEHRRAHWRPRRPAPGLPSGVRDAAAAPPTPAPTRATRTSSARPSA